MRRPSRPPSIVALRARKEALQITRDIAYPQLKTKPTWTLPAAEPVYSKWRRSYWYAPPEIFYSGGPPEPAPGWMKGVAAGAILIIAGALLAVVCAG